MYVSNVVNVLHKIMTDIFNEFGSPDKFEILGTLVEPSISDVSILSEAQ